MKDENGKSLTAENAEEFAEGAEKTYGRLLAFSIAKLLKYQIT